MKLASFHMCLLPGLDDLHHIFNFHEPVKTFHCRRVSHSLTHKPYFMLPTASSSPCFPSFKSNKFMQNILLNIIFEYLEKNCTLLCNSQENVSLFEELFIRKPFNFISLSLAVHLILKEASLQLGHYELYNSPLSFTVRMAFGHFRFAPSYRSVLLHYLKHSELGESHTPAPKQAFWRFPPYVYAFIRQWLFQTTMKGTTFTYRSYHINLCFFWSEHIFQIYFICHIFYNFFLRPTTGTEKCKITLFILDLFNGHFTQETWCRNLLNLPILKWKELSNLRIWTLPFLDLLCSCACKSWAFIFAPSESKKQYSSLYAFSPAEYLQLLYLPSFNQIAFLDQDSLPFVPWPL